MVKAKAAQRKRAKDGESRPNGAPRKDDADGTPGQLRKRQKERERYQKQAEAKKATLSPVPPPSAPADGSRQSTESGSPLALVTRCMICLEQQHAISGASPLKTPCCGQPLHRECLQTQMTQHPAAHANGALFTKPGVGGSVVQATIMRTHSCPHCNAPMTASRYAASLREINAAAPSVAAVAGGA